MNRASVVVLMLALAVGCGGSATEPSQSVNLAGVWSGVVGMGSGGGRALRVTWNATQRGAHVAGPVTVVTSPALTDTAFFGTLSGTLAGDTLSLTVAAQPQASSGCALTGFGSAAVTAGRIAGNLNLSFTSCGTLEPPSNTEIVLTKP